MMRGSRVLLLALALGAGPCAAGPSGEGGPELERILDRLARVAALYRDNALRFAVRETIYYHGHAGRKSWEFDYVYRHDHERGLEEFRLKHRYGEGRRIKPKDIVQVDDIDVPSLVLRTYSWAFLFETAQRDRFRFELLGPDEVFGRPAQRVSFEGLPPFSEGNQWVGTAWVDAETTQLLRVEARRTNEHTVWQGYQRALAALEALGPGQPPEPTYHSVETITTDFTEEKNGMRFPGEVRIERRGYDVPGNARTGIRAYLVRQVYRDYRFFSIRTREEIGASGAVR
jgi:hypothetical protein